MKTKAKGRIWCEMLPGEIGGYRWIIRPHGMLCSISDSRPCGECSDTINEAVALGQEVADHLDLEIVEWVRPKEWGISMESVEVVE